MGLVGPPVEVAEAIDPTTWTAIRSDFTVLATGGSNRR